MEHFGLWVLLTAVYQRQTPSLMAVEEPETTIHPGAIGLILDVLDFASERTQLVITTQSPEVLDAEWLEDRHLRIVTWEDGETRVAPPAGRIAGGPAGTPDERGTNSSDPTHSKGMPPQSGVIPRVGPLRGAVGMNIQPIVEGDGEVGARPSAAPPARRCGQCLSA